MRGQRKSDDMRHREFAVVFMFGLDQRRISWLGAWAVKVAEQLRLLYVSFTRAKVEIPFLYTQHYESPLVTKVLRRLQD